MPRGDDVPYEYKLLALSLMSDEQLQGVLINPNVTEANKAEVRKEIERRKTHGKTQT